MKTRVLIVDDSALVRKMLAQLINQESDMEVVGSAPNPYVARDKIVELKPDVMTLDIEMPKMDGLTFLSKLMQHYPIPTVIVSSVTKKGCQISMKALELGAVEVVPKPSEAYSITSIETQLITAVRNAARARIIKRAPIDPATIPEAKPLGIVTTNKILAIGASTGGTEALKAVLARLPKNTPGTVVVQHMPANFTKAFAERLNGICHMEVSEAVDGDAVTTGKVLIAPGDWHMVLRRDGARYFVKLKQGPRVWHQRPAVDVLFNSVADFAGTNALGVILTGMGKDGADGMKRMKDAGAMNIAQNEASCVVFGMPKAAIEAQAVDYIDHLDEIPNRIIKILSKLQ